MYKAGKRHFARLTMTLFVGLVALSACDTGTSTPTPGAVATATQAQSNVAPTSTTVAVAPTFTTLAVAPTTAPRQSGRTEGTPGALDARVTPTPKVTATADASGTIVGDNGFRPEPNGFSFENYVGQHKRGKPVAELGVNDLLKMFGDADVCVKLDNGVCTPRQEALDFLNMVNADVPGGHCEGMAVASLSMYKGVDSPTDYAPDAKAAIDLKLDDRLRGLINYYYFLQYFNPVAQDYLDTQNTTPSEVLDKLIASMKDGAPDPVNIGFYGGKPDKDGNLQGHSITPYSVEDKGNGVYWVHVYDNNYPRRTDLHMTFDRNNETWSYDMAALNAQQSPSVWAGDANSHTIGVVPLSARTGTLYCPWCTDLGSGGSAPDNTVTDAIRQLAPGLSSLVGTATPKAATAQANKVTQIVSGGQGFLMIKNSKGQRLGFDGTKYVNDMPGATFIVPKAGYGVPMKPIYFVPNGEAYNITVDGQGLNAGTSTQASVGIFGQGVAITAQGLDLNQGEQHQLNLSANAQTFGFVAGNSTVKPTFKLSTSLKSGAGATGGTTSYNFQVGNVGVTKGQQLDLSLNATSAQLNIKSIGGATKASNYDLAITKTTTTGTQNFAQHNLSLLNGDVQHLNFGGANTNKNVNLQIDHGSNGTVDSTQSVPSAPSPTATTQP